MRSKTKLIFATHNAGKLKEMQELLAGLPVAIVSAREAGVADLGAETGATFAANARHKALVVHQHTGEWAIGEDSGLCVAALNGQPGVQTARWAGPSASPLQMVEYLLTQIATVPEGRRSAWFEAALALVSPQGKEQVFSGRVDGSIALAPRGELRPTLPYDLIFIPAGHTRTFAEMSLTEKHVLSHRGRAAEQLKKFLAANF